MQFAATPTATAPSTRKSDTSMPCSPSGGIVNFEKNVTPTIGVTRTPKRSRPGDAAARGTAALGRAAGPPGAVTKVRSVLTRLSPVDHGAEQHGSRRLELRFDANRVGEPAAMSLRGEQDAARARRDDLRIRAFEHGRGVDDDHVVLGRRGLHQISEGDVTEELLRIDRRAAGAHDGQTAESRHRRERLVQALAALDEIDDTAGGRETEERLLGGGTQIPVDEERALTELCERHGEI